MIIGIDIGGTNTDVVLIDRTGVRAGYKVETTQPLTDCLCHALEIVSRDFLLNTLDRMVISTTMLTNLVMEDRLDPVGVLVIPGPGMKWGEKDFPTQCKILKGAIDHRGEEREPLDFVEVKKAVATLINEGFDNIVVVGKFSGRNNFHEISVGKYIRDNFSGVEVLLGHQVSGYLNFPRRCATSWLTAATLRPYKKFLQDIRQVLGKFQVKCPTYIMKADGGLISLEIAHNYPVDTIYSGPAASAVGASVLLPRSQSAIVVDIGGTTTDISLMLSGLPLPSTRGLKIKELFTQVKGLSLSSCPVGGDTPIIMQEGRPVFLPQRKGKAVCFGGEHPTLTDAVNVVYGIEGIYRSSSAQALEELFGTNNPQEIVRLSTETVNHGINMITDHIKKMLNEWRDEPAYRIWQVKQKDNNVDQMVLVGIGGAAEKIIPGVATALGLTPVIPEYGRIANAIGCALAKPTLSLSLRIDTMQERVFIYETGTQRPFKGEITEKNAICLAANELVNRAKNMFLDIAVDDIEVVHSEMFNVIKGYRRLGQIVDVMVQIKPGFLCRIEGEGING